MNTDNNDDKVKVTAPDDNAHDERGAEVKVEPPADGTAERSGTSVAGGLLRLLILLLLILLAGGLAAAGWYGWQWLQQERERHITLVEQQAEQIERLESRVNRLAETHVSRDSLAELRDDLAGEQQQIREELQTLAGEMQSLREAARGGQRDLILSEIDYLLRIAADSLYLANDVDTAIYALQTADTRLRRLGEPRFNPVRQLIADHLQKLNSLKLPDVQGIALKLGSMMRQISNLPLRQAQHVRAIGEQDDAKATDGNWWQRLRAGAERVFRKLVVVQQADPPPPLLTPEQTFFLYRNVELQLAAARAALLANDANSYRQSLEIAREWLNRYFDSSDPAVKNAIADITGLLDVPLQPDLPDINPALERFRALTTNDTRFGARSE